MPASVPGGRKRAWRPSRVLIPKTRVRRYTPAPMLTEITIVGFRAFARLSVPGLTRVNLIVGKNNAGKTSVLEAVEILAGGGSPYALLRGPTRRDEGPFVDEEGRSPPGDLELRHVFPKHVLAIGSRIEISGVNSGRVFASYEIIGDTSRPPPPPQLEFIEQAEGGEDRPLALKCNGDRLANEFVFPLMTPRELVHRRELERIESQVKSPLTPVHFLGTEGMSGQVLARIWDRVVLGPEEARTISALRILIPALERIAIVGRDRDPRPWRSSTSRIQGVRIKLKDDENPLPLGSMGEGSRRLLYIALAMSQAAGGFLLIDEIDTGLHYSALMRMWKLVTESARLLDVQVFATSHSSDCIQALAELAEQEPTARDVVSLHRVELGVDHTSRYSAGDIRLAVKHNIEVRG